MKTKMKWLSVAAIGFSLFLIPFVCMFSLKDNSGFTLPGWATAVGMAGSVVWLPLGGVFLIGGLEGYISSFPFWENLAPALVRQRVIIELITEHLVREEEIKDYQMKLSQIVDMNVLQPPFSYPAHKDGHLIGYGGWIHWATSGSHVYSYDSYYTGRKGHLLTVDTYTCKPFSVEKVVKFTRDYFKAEKIVWKEV